MGGVQQRETRRESRPAIVPMMRRVVLRKILHHAATPVMCVGWRAPKDVFLSSLFFSRRFHLVGSISLVFRCGIAHARRPPPSLCFLSPSFFLFVVMLHVLYRVRSFVVFHRTPPRVIFFRGRYVARESWRGKKILFVNLKEIKLHRKRKLFYFYKKYKKCH